ncbi:MAG TPA: hypothetical protein VGM86_19405 [Thermoanaerobaculia bacterium]
MTSFRERTAPSALILDELADEQRWDESFARTQKELGSLAAKVRADIRAGRVRDTRVEDL